MANAAFDERFLRFCDNDAATDLGGSGTKAVGEGDAGTTAVGIAVEA